MSVHVGGRGPGHLARVMGFSLDAFMASQSAGFWYNFLRTDTMFQESVGPTPADEPNEVIGLALSQRLWGGQTRTQVEATSAPVSALSFTDASTSPATATWAGGELTLDASSTGTARGRLRYAVSPGLKKVTWVRGGGTSDATLDIGVTAGGSTLAAAMLVSATLGVAYVYVSGGDLWLNFYRGAANTTVITNISVREVSQVSATQPTTSFKPKYQPAGLAFDGTDDNLLTNYTAGSGANFLIVKVVVPASIASTQIIAGTNSSGDSGRFRLGLTTAGLLRLSVAGVDLDGVSNLRGQTIVVGATSDVATGAIRTFAGQAQEASSAAAPVVTSTIPFGIGARNNDGVAANFFGGSIQHALAGREFIDLARFNQIANALGA